MEEHVENLKELREMALMEFDDSKSEKGGKVEKK